MCERAVSEDVHRVFGDGPAGTGDLFLCRRWEVFVFDASGNWSKGHVYFYRHHQGNLGLTYFPYLLRYTVREHKYEYQRA